MWKALPSLTAALFALPVAPAPALGQSAKGVDCYCTDSSGARVELGEMICLTVGGRSFVAQCQMSLNVPMWRELGQICPAARGRPAPLLPRQNREPSVHARLIDPHIGFSEPQPRIDMQIIAVLPDRGVIGKSP